MTTAVITFKPGETVGEADMEMRLSRIRHIPITDERNRLVGIVSNRDLLRALGKHKGAVVRIADVMTTAVHTIDQSAPAAAAVGMLLEHKIGCLPVTGDEGQLVGLVTETDFLHIAHRALTPNLSADD